MLPLCSLRVSAKEAKGDTNKSVFLVVGPLRGRGGANTPWTTKKKKFFRFKNKIDQIVMKAKKNLKKKNFVMSSTKQYRKPKRVMNNFC